jgi:hypothetical protein
MTYNGILLNRVGHVTRSRNVSQTTVPRRRRRKSNHYDSSTSSKVNNVRNVAYQLADKVHLNNVVPTQADQLALMDCRLLTAK